MEGKWYTVAIGEKVIKNSEFNFLIRGKKPSIKDCAEKIKSNFMEDTKIIINDKIFVKRKGSHCSQCDYIEFCRPE